MDCIVCGKELKGHQRKYCCYRCAQAGYKLGRSEHYIDTSSRVADLYIRFRQAFNNPETYRGLGNGFYIRVFVAACIEMGYSDSSIAKGIRRERSTICKHRLRLREEEKVIAKEFLSDNNYVYGSKYNGFSYRSTK